MRDTVCPASPVVQRRERQMPRLRHGDRDLHGLQIAHLADQHHVGILAESMAQRSGERQRVLADLALADHGLTRLVYELDGVFDGQDMTRPRGVHMVEHGGQRGALARPGRTGHQHQPLVQPRQVFARVGQVDFVHRGNALGQETHGHANALLLDEQVQAQTAQPFDPTRAIEFVRLVESGALVVAQHGLDKGANLRTIGLKVGHGPQIAVHAHDDRIALAQMEVRCVGLPRPLECLKKLRLLEFHRNRHDGQVPFGGPPQAHPHRRPVHKESRPKCYRNPAAATRERDDRRRGSLDCGGVDAALPSPKCSKGI